jgi:hypothetical protein
MDPDPAIFVIDLPKMPTKSKFFKKFFCLLLFARTSQDASEAQPGADVP